MGQQMSDNLRDRIADVLQAHQYESTYCGCGLPVEDQAHHDLHVADAVIRELKLEVEDGQCGYCQAQLPGCRYVTEWTTDE
jgi:hypothetical protein